MYPFAPGHALKHPQEGDSDKPFLNLLGELRYHARSTRPDTNTAVLPPRTHLDDFGGEPLRQLLRQRRCQRAADALDRADGVIAR